MSENIQWGFKRRFEQGVTLNNYKYFFYIAYFHHHYNKHLVLKKYLYYL